MTVLNEYYLMHKDNVAAELEFDQESGSLLSVNSVPEPLFLPLSCQNDPEKLKYWWSQRAVSKYQSSIRTVLSENGISSTQTFLLKNFGLSMTDAYWVKPKGQDVRWKDVSFHINPFREDALDFFTAAPSSDTLHALFTPSASIGGELKKKWIRKDGKIFLVKGNMPGISFQQSLNEVFATRIHEAQGFDNHATYRLMHFPDSSTGCITECFTGEDTEFIPAWELFSKYGEGDSHSLFPRWVELACMEGFDFDKVSRFLNYQTISDFLVSNIDRHLNNFGLLRNSSTLKPVGPAPLFDTGNSMFYLGTGIISYRDLFNVNISSFYPTEREIVSHVTDFSCFDTDRIPSEDDVVMFYSQDPSIAPYARVIAEYYCFKRNVLIRLSEGKSFGEIEKEASAFFGDIKERKNINACWNK